MSATAARLSQAAARHEQGDLQEAERLCRQVIQREPGQVAALSLLAEICRQTGRVETETAYIESAAQEYADYVAAVEAQVRQEYEEDPSEVKTIKDEILDDPDNAGMIEDEAFELAVQEAVARRLAQDDSEEWFEIQWALQEGKEEFKEKM